jgi:hypothetical protein
VGLVIVEGLDVEQLVTTGPQIRTVGLPAWSTIAAAVEGMQLQACPAASPWAVGLVIVEGLDVEQLVTTGPQIRTAGLSPIGDTPGMQLQGRNISQEMKHPGG